MWIKVLFAENGFILVLYDKEQRIGSWIAKDAYDLTKVVGLIEDYLTPEKKEGPSEDQS